MRYEAHQTDLPALPASIRTLDGQQIDTSTDSWEVKTYIKDGRPIHINWRHLAALAYHGTPIMSPRAEHLIKLYLVTRLQTRKPRTVLSDYERLRFFARWLLYECQYGQTTTPFKPFQWDELDEAMAQAFLAWCNQQSADADSIFGVLRMFYQWGVGRNYPDFNWTLYQILKTLTPIPHAKGHHVRFRHPTKGPFSPAEMQLIRQTLKQQQGRECDRVIIMLHLELGCNPSATARLLNKDLKRIETAQSDWYQLDVPRVKKRNPYRETKRRPISQRLGELLYRWQQGNPDDRLLHWLGQRTPQESIRYAMRRWVRETNLISPRTGSLLAISPRRFRYTYATHLAEEGASRFHIAELLDHNSLHCVDVYIATTSAITDQIARATDEALQPVIGRFLGKVLTAGDEPGSEALPVDSLIPAAATHMELPLLNVGGVGLCGRDVRTNGLCQLFPPLSCYLCPSFAAFKDGPHQALLDGILQFCQTHEDRVDRRILSQLDETRQAIEEVITRCHSQSGSELGYDVATSGDSA